MSDERNPTMLRLCYVEDGWAWFTSAPLDMQWGDDWNDAPYEHNAGTPYDGTYLASERVPHTLVRVALWGSYETPANYHLNSPWSVQEINAGATPWLRPDRYDSVTWEPIYAGTTLADFTRKCNAAAIEVYVRSEG